MINETTFTSDNNNIKYIILMPIRLIKELYHIKDTKVDEVVEHIKQTSNTL